MASNISRLRQSAHYALPNNLTEMLPCPSQSNRCTYLATSRSITFPCQLKTRRAKQALVPFRHYYDIMRCSPHSSNITLENVKRDYLVDVNREQVLDLGMCFLLGKSKGLLNWRNKAIEFVEQNEHNSDLCAQRSHWLGYGLRFKCIRNIARRIIGFHCDKCLYIHYNIIIVTGL